MRSRVIAPSLDHACKTVTCRCCTAHLQALIWESMSHDRAQWRTATTWLLQSTSLLCWGPCNECNDVCEHVCCRWFLMEWWMSTWPTTPASHTASTQTPMPRYDPITILSCSAHCTDDDLDAGFTIQSVMRMCIMTSQETLAPPTRAAAELKERISGCLAVIVDLHFKSQATGGVF